MAYINKKTFDIIQTGSCTASERDWFYVDDLLADTIQVLNARGYLTESCNPGVPYCTAREAVLRNVRDNTGVIPDIASIARAYRARVPGVNILRIDRINLRDYKVIRRDYTAQSTYITFTDDVYFRRLPSESRLEGRTLIHDYPEKLVGFDFVTAQFKFCQELFDWSCSLPLNLFIKTR